jgi:hypothetical protein
MWMAPYAAGKSTTCTDLPTRSSFEPDGKIMAIQASTLTPGVLLSDEKRLLGRQQRRS